MVLVKKLYEDEARTTQFYPQTHTQAVIDTNGHNLDTLLNKKENITEIQTVASGTTLTAVTEKLYKFTYAVSDLTVTLTAPTITTKASVYIFRFLTDSTVTNIAFNTPANTRLLEPDNLSWDTDTEYEVSIMFDGVDYVLSYNTYVVHTTV